MGFASDLGLGGASDFGSFLGQKSLQNDAQSFSKFYARNKYQWAVKDLKKAGLNPILAVGGGIGGGSASAGLGAFRSTIGQTAKSSAEARKVQKEETVLDNQAKLIEQQYWKTFAEKSTAAAIARVTNAEAEKAILLADIDAKFYDSALGTTARQVELGAKSVEPAIRGLTNIFPPTRTLKHGKQFTPSRWAR